MYHPLLDTFIVVAESGSFLKASEKLYISPVAVMKQMNQLEALVGLPLLVRTRQGITLTAAGKSIYQDAEEFIGHSREMLRRAYKAEEIEQIVIRLGTSALYPCKVLMERWGELSGAYPQYRLKVVPFEDSATEAAFAGVGKKYDLMVGPWDSVHTARFNRFVKLGRYRFCVAMPQGHRLSGRESLSVEDLCGQKIMMQKVGNSPVNDHVRRTLEEERLGITIVDVPSHYDLEVFNRCEEEACLLLSLECWSEVHPSLCHVPFMVEDRIPYGIIYSARASQEVKYFLELFMEMRDEGES